VTARLEGIGVVLTRPRAAAEAMRAPLEAEGAHVFVFPALAIEPIAPGAAMALAHTSPVRRQRQPTSDRA